MGKKGSKIVKEKSRRCKEYYALNNPSWTEEQCKEAAKNFNKKHIPDSIEFWKDKYPEKTIKECEQLKQKYIQAKKLKNPNYLEHYINKYPNLTLKEQQNKLQEYRDSINRCKIFYWRNKYPNKTDAELEQYIKEAKRKCVTHDTSGDNNPNSKTKTTKLQRQQRSPNSIEFYKKHYPDLTFDEQNKLLLEHRSKNREKVKNAIKTTNIEYYLNKGMSMEEAKKALHDRQNTFSIEKCIEKYGELDGYAKWEERQEKWKKKLQKHFIENGDGRSIQSGIANELFNKIDYILFGSDGARKSKEAIREKYLYNKDTNKGYSYDYCYRNKFIEFNGDYWHMNPKIYNANDINSTVNENAQTIWDKDKDKENLANKFGYEVLSIWEFDYKENKQREINKCINFLLKL